VRPVCGSGVGGDRPNVAREGRVVHLRRPGGTQGSVSVDHRRPNFRKPAAHDFQLVTLAQPLLERGDVHGGWRSRMSEHARVHVAVDDDATLGRNRRGKLLQVGII